MSPMKPVTVRRGMVWAAMLAMVALPGATWFAAGELSDTSNQADRTAARTSDVVRLTRQVQALSVRTAADARATTSALCALRDDLQVRVNGSRKFLRAHPHGFLGVSAKEIRDAAANQQRTIAALSGIDCPD